jgi:hypothetical protein
LSKVNRALDFGTTSVLTFVYTSAQLHYSRTIRVEKEEKTMKKTNRLAGTKMKMRFQNVCLVLFTLIASDALAFNIGDHVETTGPANVRSTPAGTPPLGTQSQGVIGTITGGPTVATLSGTSYTWYDINFPSSPNGWVASINLESAPPTVTTAAATSVIPSSHLS